MTSVLFSLFVKLGGVKKYLVVFNIFEIFREVINLKGIFHKIKC